MKRFIFTTLFLVLTSWLIAQRNYWQQEVNYTIEVKLNDHSNTLEGFETIEYHNNSPDTLRYLYLHIYPNAYRNQETTLAKQLVQNGKIEFRFANRKQLGYIEQLNFHVNAETVKWEYDTDHIDICKIYLNAALKPGGSINLSSPFKVKIPENFSRLGHVGQSYQISQWYPKPAVYDKDGWHPMPYLDQGEFYSEFGSFDVKITLPKNYVVGATGDLQDASEIEFLNNKVAETEEWKKNSLPTWNRKNADLSFPESDTVFKTLHYVQHNVHDFAWFADKRFYVLKGEVELPQSKRRVTTWVLFTNQHADLWANAINYVNDAVLKYSKWVGDYQYNQATAVDGTISAGGGMEYPNITIIGEEKNRYGLDIVIAHEVGHNWFYGMLGSNERDHAWMDEGINSYYEHRYTAAKYPKLGMVSMLNKKIERLLDLQSFHNKYIATLAYQFAARERRDQPIELTAAKFTEFNYGAMVYEKTSLLLDYLEGYLGKEKFDSVMHKYFERWQLKHPQPQDLQTIFEQETGKKLDWLFEDLLKTTKQLDYKITGVYESGENEHTFNLNQLEGGEAQREKGTKEYYAVVVKNAGLIQSPFSVSLLKRDSIVSTKWFDGFGGTDTVFIKKQEADKIKIDAQEALPEINRRNNTYSFQSPHYLPRLRVRLFGSVENPNYTQIFVSPYLGWNNNDKLVMGLAFYNSFLPSQKFNFLLAPAAGSGSRNIIGVVKFRYNFFPERIQRFSIGLDAKRFSYMLFPEVRSWSKIQPHFTMEFKKKNILSPYTQFIEGRAVFAFVQTRQEGFLKYQSYYVNELSYRLEREAVLHPFMVKGALRQGKNFATVSIEGKFTISYPKKGTGFDVRLFAGGFLFYNKGGADVTAPLPRLYLSNNSSYNFAEWWQRDYMLDENLVDRNGYDRFVGRQVTGTEGGFKSLTQFGATNKFLASANFSSSIYKYIPIRPFVGTAVILDELHQYNFAAEIGVSLSPLKDVFEIHFPIATTKNILDQQTANGANTWYKRITYTLKWDFNKSPAEWIKKFLK